MKNKIIILICTLFAISMVILFFCFAPHEKIVEFDFGGYRYDDYNSIYNFTDDTNILDVNENYYKTCVIGCGLDNIGENHISSYGDYVYRFMFAGVSLGVEPEICIRISCNEQNGKGKLVVYKERDLEEYQIIEKNLSKADVKEFKGIIKDFQAKDLEVFDEASGDDGGFYGFEFYENGKHDCVIRWPNRDNYACYELMTSLEKFVDNL